ncbi:MAG TPA: hypothetical protein GX513_01800 [Firmicutes bacterium]|nr:hypothetical protein [Bacillota bacterium]
MLSGKTFSRGMSFRNSQNTPRRNGPGKKRPRSPATLAVGLLTVTLALTLTSLGGCFSRQAPPPPPVEPPSSDQPPQEKPSPSTWLALQPGIKLTYEDRTTGQETSTEQCAPSTLDGQEVIPVLTDDGEYISYVTEKDGWLVEVGAKDPNGRAAWPEPVRLYPLRPEKGMTWKAEDHAGTNEYTIESIEELETPAGRFRAARVVVKPGDSTAESPAYRFWYDVQSGVVVKTGDAVLTKQETVEPRKDPGLPQ